MNFGSLFAGIGGLDLGLEQAGMTCKWQVEIDEHATRVLEKHWPNVPKYRDVREVGSHNLESVDLICGGFPCQPFSIAGKRLGQDDDRYLWPEMLRVVAEIKPHWVVAENVSGIALKSGDELERVCCGLESAGYEVFPPLDLPSCAFGLPTLERRLDYCRGQRRATTKGHQQCDSGTRKRVMGTSEKLSGRRSAMVSIRVQSLWSG